MIVTLIYYAATLFKDLPEMWVRTTHNSYLPVLQMASVLGLAQCRALPFVHSISGCDTTSYPFFTGKKVWLNRCKEMDIPALEDVGDPEDSASHTVSPEVI